MCACACAREGRAQTPHQSFIVAHTRYKAHTFLPARIWRPVYVSNTHQLTTCTHSKHTERFSFEKAP